MSPQSDGPRLVTEGLTTIPAKESMMARDKSIPIDPIAVKRIRDYLRGAESRIRDVMDEPEGAAFHYFCGCAAAAQACLAYLGED